MSRYLRGAFLTVMGLAVSFVLYRSLRTFDPSVLLCLGPFEVMLLLLVRGAGIALNVVSVQILLSAFRLRVPTGPLFLVLNASSAGNYTTPFKIGLPLRIFLYHRCLSIPTATATAALAVESYASLLATASFSLLVVREWYGQMVPLVSALVLCLVLFAFWFWRTVPSGTDPLLAVSNEIEGPAKRFRTRMQHALRAAVSAARTSRKPALIMFLAALVLDLVLSGLLLQFTLRALGYDAELLRLVSFQCASFLFGVFSMLPMGLGAKEVGLVFLLGRLGIPSGPAFAAAAVLRLLTTGLTLVLGVASGYLLGLRKSST